MSQSPEDLCPQSPDLPEQTTKPHAAPLWLSSVYQCESPDQADGLLGGELPGYVYSRDGHPNADMLARRCRELHGTECAAITSSGMAALAVALLSQLEQGEHVVVSSQLYGASLELLTSESARLGIGSSVVDTCDLKSTSAAMTNQTRLVVVETITNPLLRVSDVAGLAEICQSHQAQLLVDNSFASPAICRPKELGADLVMESLTKIMNGHSDSVLGLLCGNESSWGRVPKVLSRWGLASSPMDCWLSLRGMATLALRARQASENALSVAEFLSAQKRVEAVFYPGLKSHPDHQLARRQFGDQFGSIVSFTLGGGRAAAERFIAAGKIPFCPSLGEVSTTLSHPQSTSHRGMSEAERKKLGIAAGTIRLSVGIESAGQIVERLEASLNGLD